MEPNPADYRDINRANWDSRVPHHEAGYELDKFRNDPKHLSSVVRFDLPRLPDLTGKRGVHLQCHIGSDTVSLARLVRSSTSLARIASTRLLVTAAASFGSPASNEI